MWSPSETLSLALGHTATDKELLNFLEIERDRLREVLVSVS